MTETHIPSAVSDAEADMLGRLARNQDVLEFGSQYGRSTIALARFARSVHSVDWHRGDAFCAGGESLQPLLDNLGKAGVEDRVAIHVSGFTVSASAFKPEYFGFAFIDGAHDAASAYLDLSTAWPLVQIGGRIALHDYGLFGVKDGIDRWITEDSQRCALEQVVETLAVVRKRA